MSRYDWGRTHPGIERLESAVDAVRKQGASHPIYSSLDTIEAVNSFMEHHVFAVWDFMSLLKSLQRQFTCVEVPWLPKGSPRVRRLIKEIVLGEKSDDVDVNPAHFDLYRAAMVVVGANTGPIDAFMRDLRCGCSIEA